MAELLDALAIDRAWLQRHSVVVTGSNGKGSTAAMCAAIGRAYGLRTGLFTSPHLFRFNERIRVDGKPNWRRGLRALEAAGRNRHRCDFSNGAASNSAPSKRCLRWPASTFRKANASSPCSKPASAAATIRSAWSARCKTCVTSVDLRACRTARPFAGTDRIRQERRLRRRRHHRLRRELPRACGRISSNIIALATSRRCFVRDEIGIDNESVGCVGAAIRLPVRRSRFSWRSR